MFSRSRRKAKQGALRKKKDFKVVPGHLPGANNGGGDSTGHVSVADAIASLEGGKGATHPRECAAPCRAGGFDALSRRVFRRRKTATTCARSSRVVRR